MLKSLTVSLAALSAACASAAATPESASPATAQNYTPPAETVRAAMQKLAWLEGEWRGEGWRLNRQGERETHHAKEIVTPQIGGIILTVEGLGWDFNDAGEKIVGHHAFGVLSFDPQKQAYQFSAYVQQGYQSHSSPTVGENSLEWSLAAGPDVEMRYKARLNDDGEWLETGEHCTSNGCVEISGMRLTKVASE